MAHLPSNALNKILLRGSTALMTAALAAALTVTSMTGSEPLVATAQAQDVSLSVQFRSALEPHGRWSKHGRWGEVWIPAKRDRDWRPYTVGRWAYTDEWGWYWASDEDFGYVTYHYGRWVRDPEFGWVWIPGNEWAPAWVQWRRGEGHAGWAPLPPRDVFYDYDDDPDYWVFVSFNNFTSPNLFRVLAPRQQRVVYIRETVIVNRTIIVDGGRDRDRRSRIAVNPGIEPRIVAARIGRPVQVSNVKPVVVAGTVGVQGAVEVRTDSKDRKRERVRAEISASKETIQPAKDVPPPQALKKDEEGRFGERPPQAAKEQAQRQQQPDGAKGAPADAAKSTTSDDAKSRSDDGAKAKSEDASKATSGDAAKSKADDDAKSKSGDDARTKSEDAGRAKSGEAAKPKSDDDARDARTRQPEPKGEAKSRATDSDKGKSAEPRQAAPQSAPEPKQAAPKSAPEPRQAAPKSAPEPRQAAPRAAPEPKQAEPKAAAEPRQAAPKAAPPAAKGKDNDEVKKGG